jgi:hypothetical protein
LVVVLVLKITLDLILMEGQAALVAAALQLQEQELTVKGLTEEMASTVYRVVVAVEPEHLH